MRDVIKFQVCHSLTMGEGGFSRNWKEFVVNDKVYHDFVDMISIVHPVPGVIFNIENKKYKVFNIEYSNNTITFYIITTSGV